MGTSARARERFAAKKILPEELDVVSPEHARLPEEFGLVREIAHAERIIKKVARSNAHAFLYNAQAIRYNAHAIRYNAHVDRKNFMLSGATRRRSDAITNRPRQRADAPLYHAGTSPERAGQSLPRAP